MVDGDRLAELLTTSTSLTSTVGHVRCGTPCEGHAARAVARTRIAAEDMGVDDRGVKDARRSRRAGVRRARFARQLGRSSRRNPSRRPEHAIASAALRAGRAVRYRRFRPSEHRALAPRREGTRPPMPSLTHDAVIDAMRTVQEPELGRDLIALDMVKNVVIDGSALSMTIELTTPACPLKDEIERTTNAALGGDRGDAGRHHLGRDGPALAAAPGRAARARASRTSSPSPRARAASARARSASTSRSRWPRRAHRSACSTPTSPARTSR